MDVPAPVPAAPGGESGVFFRHSDGDGGLRKRGGREKEKSLGVGWSEKGGRELRRESGLSC